MKLKIEPLTRTAFAPFGDVIDCSGAGHYTINDGFAERYHDLAKIDVASNGGRPLVNIFRAKPRELPFKVALMERHPLSSQAFVPLLPRAFLVIVAAFGQPPLATDLRCFRTTGMQGINYARGIWHHPLIALEGLQDFLVIDRGGPGDNCDEIQMPADIIVEG
ncbi:ureidoglycolate lyase [Dongia sp.]|uniref:ureidoglycolate lyase n=1 Tax=Dongia sp. TaxID=1977262 RepID=UPI0035B4B6D3